MPKIPQISGRNVIKKLEKIGYEETRQRGSHVRLVHPDSKKRHLTVPLHKTIKRGLLSKIIKDAELTVDEFIEL